MEDDCAPESWQRQFRLHRVDAAGRVLAMVEFRAIAHLPKYISNQIGTGLNLVVR